MTSKVWLLIPNTPLRLTLGLHIGIPPGLPRVYPQVLHIGV